MTQPGTNNGPGPGYDGPRLVTSGLELETSTDRSDEVNLDPGSTLSFLIPCFQPFWHVLGYLALNLEYRKEHVCTEVV